LPPSPSKPAIHAKNYDPPGWAGRAVCQTSSSLSAFARTLVRTSIPGRDATIGSACRVTAKYEFAAARSEKMTSRRAKPANIAGTMSASQLPSEVSRHVAGTRISLVGRSCPERMAGPRLDPRRLPDDRVDVLIQSHRDMGVVEALRCEKQRRLAKAAGDQYSG
jgi:hypothetical protein